MQAARRVPDIIAVFIVALLIDFIFIVYLDRLLFWIWGERLGRKIEAKE